jgi:endonuclease G
MKTAIFSIILLLSTPSLATDASYSDVAEIFDFIQKYSTSSLKEDNAVSSNLSKSKDIKITKPSNNLLQLDYEGFTVWLDCEKRAAVKFRYNVQRDTGSFKRKKSFYYDPQLPKSCQQTSTKSYKKKGQRYDRGHLVPANHLDYSKNAIKQSNYMTNILPQAANMNRGAWLLTEEITECYRDIDELLIIGGAILGHIPNTDYFVKSHGIKTPMAYWKVIIRGVGNDERAIAWIVPNSQKAKRKMLDHYLVTVDDIERVTGEQIPVADYIKHEKPARSWMIPRGCNKG